MFGRQKQKTNEQNTHPTLCVGSQVRDKDLPITAGCSFGVCRQKSFSKVRRGMGGCQGHSTT